MFMRVTKGRSKPGCWDQYEAVYRKFVENGPRPFGLLARWLLRSVEDRDLGFSLSLWESREAMEAYERSDAVRGEILPHLAPYLTGDFVAHHCEVNIQSTPGLK